MTTPDTTEAMARALILRRAPLDDDTMCIRVLLNEGFLLREMRQLDAAVSAAREMQR